MTKRPTVPEDHVMPTGPTPANDAEIPDLASETHAERARLAAILDGLSPEQWASQSLCDGWLVREVVAHMTMPYRTKTLRFIAGFARARFSFDRYADRAALADTKAMTDSDLLAQLHANIRHPWQPPGGGPAAALSHDVIHGLDITEPLGLPSAPVERIALVVQHSSKRSLKYFGTDLTETQLVATDADVAIGHGTAVELPVKDLLLVITGRQTLPTP